MGRSVSRSAFLLALLAVIRPSAQTQPAWPDTVTSRLEALALIETLNAELPASRGALDIPAALFEHEAPLYAHDNRPFSEVREVYQRETLAFPPPPAAGVRR